ncbi:MAG: hypothetical protein M3Q96_00800 [Pseudomonadota bacterium]|nr:hypothetical protein [Pseudomonadota bacterium]MDQ3228761.1 hypothetical protein [Pseudomonadota bacterium]
MSTVDAGVVKHEFFDRRNQPAAVKPAKAEALYNSEAGQPNGFAKPQFAELTFFA